MNKLFNIPPIKPKDETCRTCRHRQRWQANSKVIQYCGVRISRRTQNGLLKIKVTDEACVLYEKENSKRIGI